jgi:hypothetical protein
MWKNLMFCNTLNIRKSYAKKLPARYADANIELVVGPTTGGILLAHETGKALGTRAIFTERENGKMTLKRGFHDSRRLQGFGGGRYCYHWWQRQGSYGSCQSSWWPG